MRYLALGLLLLISSACATGRVTNYPSHAELNEAAIVAATAHAAEFDAGKDKTVAIIPISGLHGDNLYPQQAIEHYLAAAMLTGGMRPMERNAELIKALALNAGGFSGGIFPYLSGNGSATYEADLVTGARQTGTLAPEGLPISQVTKDGTTVFKPVDEQVLRFLSNPGITKTFSFPQPDYFLSYDIIEAGLRFSEIDVPESPEPMTQRQARVKLRVKLIDAHTAEIMAARVIEGTQADVVPISAMAVLERPYYRYYGSARYGTSQSTGKLGGTEPSSGISSLREKTPYAGGKYASISAGALTFDSIKPSASLRFDYDAGKNLGIMAGFGLASFDQTVEAGSFSATTSIFFINPQVAGKLILPVSEHVLPFLLLGPELKIINGADDTKLTPGFLFGLGSLFPITDRFVLRGDLMAHVSDEISAAIPNLTNSNANVEFVLLNSIQTELSIGLGVKF